MSTSSWLSVTRGDAPLVVSLPHTGTEIPAEVAGRLVSPWLARKDTDWWIDRLFGFTSDRGATVVRTSISRTVIDANRDPSGVSLYPGQATTELSPTTTFDGEPLYRDGAMPSVGDIASRRTAFFEPYHAALREEIGRLRAAHPRIVLCDCHSIRSVIPRLFFGALPHINIGTNDGTSCDPMMTRAIEAICDATTFSHVTNGRFKGGFITRAHGEPHDGVHAIQMELACRSYMHEPDLVSETNWPSSYDQAIAAPMRAVLSNILEACLGFATANL